MLLLRFFLLPIFLFYISVSYAAEKLDIEITQGTEAPINIAIVPFNGIDKKLSSSVLSIIKRNLLLTSQFNIYPGDKLYNFPSSVEDVNFSHWSDRAVEYLIIGKINSSAKNEISLRFSVVDIFNKSMLLDKTFVIENSNVLFQVANKISDIIYHAITGINGIFSSRIIYVNFSPATSLYSLNITDIYGYKIQTILSSPQPIISPKWGANANQIVYISFEDGYSHIYTHNLVTRERKKITSFNGLNSSPSWSNNGKYLAYASSVHGNPNIYLLDMRSNSTIQLTFSNAIDTEPSWSLDDKYLLFTSNRKTKKPSIYRYSIDEKSITPVFLSHSVYYTSASYAMNNSVMVMLKLHEGKHQVISRNIKTGVIKNLSYNYIADSPSVSFNGYQVVFSVRNKEGISSLFISSLNGLNFYTITSKTGDMFYPSWERNY